MPPEDNNKVTTTAGKRPRYFYGWNVVAASFMAQLAYAEHFSSMLGLFFRPLQNQFGWSRSALAGVQTTARLIEAVAAPVVGPLIDRYGPRVLMPIGAVIVGLAMLGVTQISTIWQFYLLRGVVVAVGFTFMGALVTDVAINNWFVRKRGRAIAIARVGSNLSNVILTPITVFVIAASGWQTMFVIFAVLTWVVVLVPSVVLMRRRPEDMGLYPDGIPPGATPDEAHQEEEPKNASGEGVSTREPVWTRREVLMTAGFWLLTISFAIDSMAYQAINISLAPYIQDLGYEDTMLAAVVTFRAAVMAIAVLLMGFVAEQANRALVRAAPFLIQAAGAFLFLFAQEPVFLWLAVAVYGLGFSGVLVTQEVVWANYFGRLSLGRVRSLGYLIAFGFGASGPIAMNAVFDILGSYRPAFMVIVGLFVAASLLMALAKPSQAKHYATAD